MKGILSFFRRAKPSPSPAAMEQLARSSQASTAASDRFMQTMQLQAFQARDDRIDPEPQDLQATNQAPRRYARSA